MSYKLEFIYDSECGVVRAMFKFSDIVSLRHFNIELGYFLVGQDEFFVTGDAEFLTTEDMKAIIKKMEEYNA